MNDDGEQENKVWRGRIYVLLNALLFLLLTFAPKGSGCWRLAWPNTTCIAEAATAGELTVMFAAVYALFDKEAFKYVFAPIIKIAIEIWRWLAEAEAGEPENTKQTPWTEPQPGPVPQLQASPPEPEPISPSPPTTATLAETQPEAASIAPAVESAALYTPPPPPAYGETGSSPNVQKSARDDVALIGVILIVLVWMLILLTLIIGLWLTPAHRSEDAPEEADVAEEPERDEPVPSPKAPPAAAQDTHTVLANENCHEIAGKYCATERWREFTTYNDIPVFFRNGEWFCDIKPGQATKLPPLWKDGCAKATPTTEPN